MVYYVEYVIMIYHIVVAIFVEEFAMIFVDDEAMATIMDELEA